MSQLNCTSTSLYQIDTSLWVSILSEKIGGPSTLNEIPYSGSGKFYRPGFQWISDYTYNTSDDMIVARRLSKPNEIFVERSAIVQEPYFKHLKAIQKNYLIIEPIPVKIFSCS
ncbi:MAG TPA: hypothetical protein VIS75_05300 [Chitinophagaceae bacterium]